MTASPVDRIRELGGELFLVGDRLKYRIPAGNLEARQLIAEIRRDREAVIAMLRDIESKPPSVEEVRAALPPGVKLVSYNPKQSPFAVAPVSVVTNAGKFYRAYLAESVPTVGEARRLPLPAPGRHLEQAGGCRPRIER